MSKLFRDQSGYSLVEVMVAIMLLAIAIIPMVGMFDAGLRAAVLGGNYDRARALAHEELEEIRALPYSNPDAAINSVVEIYPPGTRTCTDAVPATFTSPSGSCQVETAYARLNNSAGSIVDDATARTMMRVKVTVTWSAGSYTTTGLVSKEMS